MRAKERGEKRDRGRGREGEKGGEKFEDPVPAEALLGGGRSPKRYPRHPSSRAINRGKQ